MFALCRPALTYDGFDKVDMAIEAVIENVELKQKIFADLEAACRPDAILSTNTSTIDITKCAAKMRAPERIVGAHFFSPAHVMQLFEIIRTDRTPPQVLCDTLGLSKQIKKTPVVVGNCTGFAVNRVFFPYTMSACLLLDLGATVRYRRRQDVRHAHGPVPPERPRGHGHRRTRRQELRGGLPRPRLRVLDHPEPDGGEPLRREERAGFYGFDASVARARPRGAGGFCGVPRRGGAAAPIAGGPLLALTQNDIEMIFFPVVNEACRCLAEESPSKPAT